MRASRVVEQAGNATATPNGTAAETTTAASNATATAGANATATPNATTAPGGGTVDIGVASTPTQTQRLLADYIPEWLRFAGWQFVAAVAVVLLGVLLSRYLVRLLGRPVARRFKRQSVAQSVLRTIRAGTILFSVLVAAGVAGLQIGNIVLSVTVFSAAVGLVLAPIVGSVINGLFVLADQPYEINDMIQLEDGTTGFVEDITIRYTKIITTDNTFLVIPNSRIRERQVTNFSGEDERTRLSLGVLVTYESDVPAARDLIERAARDCEDVIEGGPDIRIGGARYTAKPTCQLDAYGDNGVSLTLRYWTYKPAKHRVVRSNVQTRIGELFEESDAEIEMAYPHTHLVFDETSGEMAVSLREAGRDVPSERDGDAPPTDLEEGVDGRGRER